MRKVRDFDSELKALEHKARTLKERKARQLGELLIATGAHALDTEMLTGALLAMVETSDVGAKEGWRARGAAFFRVRTRQTLRGTRGHERGDPASDDRAPST